MVVLKIKLFVDEIAVNAILNLLAIVVEFNISSSIREEIKVPISMLQQTTFSHTKHIVHPFNSQYHRMGNREPLCLRTYKLLP